MRTTLGFMAFLILLAGCQPSYVELERPVEGAIGSTIARGVLVPSREKVEYDTFVSADEISSKTKEKINIQSSAIVKAAATSAGYSSDIIKDVKAKSNKIQIMEKFAEVAQIGPLYAYKCAVADEYTVNFVEGTDINAKAEIARGLGQSLPGSAKVEFQQKRGNESGYLVKNDNVCTAYLAAGLKETWHGPWWNPLRYFIPAEPFKFIRTEEADDRKENNFILRVYDDRPPDATNGATPAFAWWQSPAAVPEYRLEAGKDDDGTTIIKVLSNQKNDPVRTIKFDELNGKFLTIETIEKGRGTYLKVYVKIKGSISGDKINVDWARLSAKQYKMVFS